MDKHICVCDMTCFALQIQLNRLDTANWDELEDDDAKGDPKNNERTTSLSIEKGQLSSS